MPVPPPPEQAARVLAFDTSTQRLAVALAAGGALWGHNTEGGASASAGLLPQVHALCAQAGLALADLQAVAFGCGPGAFTGLRTACAVAQGLGYGLALPLLPIDSLLIVAEDARVQADSQAPQLHVAVAMDARMQETYAARYLWQGGHWQVLDAPALYTLPALAAAWLGLQPQVLAGTALPALAPLMPAPTARRIEHELDRAAALLRLALHAHAAGQGIDAAQALPLYLRDKVALTTAERAAVQRAKAEAAAG